MTARRVIARLGLGAALVLLVTFLYGLSDPSRGRPDDFVVFWAAARIHHAGGNPYDPALLLAEERLANWTAPHAYRIWEPPWVLPVTMPFAALSYRVGRTLWFFLHLGAIVLAADLLWRVYDGEPRRRAPTVLLAFVFAPSIITWRTGQLAPLVLLGLAGFLFALQRGRDLGAGACLALAAAKPHVVHLVWPAVLAWAVMARRSRVLAGAAITGVALVAVASVSRPTVLMDFITSAASTPPIQASTTFGTLLRRLSDWLTGSDRLWLNAVAPVVGIGWLAWYGVRRRQGWQWERELPLLVVVSLLTAPFAWIYDAGVAVVAVVAGWAALRARSPGRARQAIIGAFVALNVVIMAMNIGRVSAASYVWAFMGLLALWMAATHGVPWQAATISRVRSAAGFTDSHRTTPHR